MPWIQLILETVPEEAQRLSDLLSDHGAEAVTMQDAADQPLYEPPPGATPLWNRTRVIALYPAETEIDPIIEALTEALAPNELPAWRAEALEDKDWNRAWMDSFQPMRFGERLWIVPSWTTPPEPDHVNLLLDPGLAFGTGTHPTTRLCLEWLDAHPPRGLDVIDYGCGSGILAIAAGKLGATAVRGVDNDPQALLATRDNADRNGLSGIISTWLPGALPEQQTDLLLANILAGPLVELAPRFAALVRPGGRIVLSGILAEQAEMVASAYREWFHMKPPTQQEDWVRLDGERK